MSEPRPSSLQPDGLSPRSDIDVVDLLEESVAVFGLDMRVTAWNAAAERLYGWNRVEVIGGVIQAAVRCSPSEPLRVILAKVHETGTWRGEFTRTTKSGGLVAVAARWSLRRDASGRPLDIVETSRDVTEVRHTEEALARVQYQYQTLFQASTAAFWELDIGDVENMVRALPVSGQQNLGHDFAANPDFLRCMLRAVKVLDVNSLAIAMFGNGDREALLRDFDSLWSDATLPIFGACIAAIFDGQPHYTADVALSSLDGQRFDTLFTVSRPEAGTDRTRLLAGIVDVTESKRAKVAQEISERRYRDLFHFLPLPLFQLDSQETVEILARARADGVVDFAEYIREQNLTDQLLEGVKIKEVNRAAVTVLRARSVDEFTGSIARYWTESPDIFRDVVAARYAGKSHFEALTKIVAHDGTILDTLFFAAFAPITGDHTSSLIGLIDITDRIKTQEMLTRVQAEIAHAARVSVLGELTASIAHEVAQPLTAIETNTEASLLWLAKFPPDIDEVRQLATRTAAEAQRAANIIHRIRSMAARAKPEQALIEVNSIIEEAVLFLRHELQRNDVRSVLRLAPNLPNILGDRVQLQQVIVNLGLNAIQAMVSGGNPGRILSVQTSAVPAGGLAIVVEDTGPGIGDETLPRIFESFYTTKESGMGIGLPICRSIIEALGGKITASNQDGGPGARFYIALPAPPADGFE